MRHTFLCAAVLVVGACDGASTRPTPTSLAIAYLVTGTAGRALTITYTPATGSTSQVTDAALPWSTIRQARSGDALYVSAQNGNDPGCLTAEIREQLTGRTLQAATSCGAFAVATATGILQ